MQKNPTQAAPGCAAKRILCYLMKCVPMDAYYTPICYKQPPIKHNWALMLQEILEENAATVVLRKASYMALLNTMLNRKRAPAKFMGTEKAKLAPDGLSIQQMPIGIYKSVRFYANMQPKLKAIRSGEADTSIYCKLMKILNGTNLGEVLAYSTQLINKSVMFVHYNWLHLKAALNRLQCIYIERPLSQAYNYIALRSRYLWHGDSSSALCQTMSADWQTCVIMLIIKTPEQRCLDSKSIWQAPMMPRMLAANCLSYKHIFGNTFSHLLLKTAD